MKEIVNISALSPLRNFDRTVSFAGSSFRITRLGTNYDLQLTEQLIRKYDNQVDAICLSHFPKEVHVKGKVHLHPQVRRLTEAARYTPVITGDVFKNIYFPWIISKYSLEQPQLFRNKKVGFYAGMFLSKLVPLFEEFSREILLADPYFVFQLPYLLHSSAQLNGFISLVHPLLAAKSLHKTPLEHPKSFVKPHFIRSFLDCDIFIGSSTQFELVELNRLEDKTIVSDFINPELLAKLKNAGVKNIISCIPDRFNLPDFNFALVESILRLSKDLIATFTIEDVYEMIEEYDLKPMIIKAEPCQRRETFAFIAHPLSFSDLFRHPMLKPVQPLAKKSVGVGERLAGRLPAAHYGSIKGIKSAHSGKEVVGEIYSIFDTPAQLMRSNPEAVYKKLVKLAHAAKKNGSKIIGLGAYTKVVGDAGVSVARRSPIPVTTGNSLSSAATLWASDLVTAKMGLIPQLDGVYQGRVTVIGATGSIGKVSAKLLSAKWKELVLVAPTAYKLLSLKEEIEVISPNCKVMIASEQDKYTRESDLIVTTTSAAGQRVLDIMTVKPGCVICDVSRPFDISEEDAVKRPDVLVIASGEVELPGQVRIDCDIGLHGKVVYACLAETALLALEGRLESFTLSRNLDYHKVQEIDRMARKHGVKLSAIMGHNTEITDEEIALCRDLALQALAHDWTPPQTVLTSAETRQP